MSHSTTSSFLETLRTEVRNGVVTRAQINDVAARLGLSTPNWFTQSPIFRVAEAATGRPGRPAMTYRVPALSELVTLKMGFVNDYTPDDSSFTPDAPVVVPVPQATHITPQQFKHDTANTEILNAATAELGNEVMLGSADTVPMVPAVNPNYVPWGPWEQMKRIIASKMFLPMMVTGPSGNGKTELCEQLCAELKREYVRINVTAQTDEDDLIGGMRLVDGDTKYALGPVPLAMLRGAVVNFDEIDLGGAAMMCLQPVLEGKPLYLKKLRRYIYPAPGFTVLMTGNTKGKGDETGAYAHTMFMNEAMLERIVVMFNLEWAPTATEQQILRNILKSYHLTDETLVAHLVEFATTTRVRFKATGGADQIATRRLIHTLRVYAALGARDINEALTATLSRYSPDTITGFMLCWNAIHDTVTASPSGVKR